MSARLTHGDMQKRVTIDQVEGFAEAVIEDAMDEVFAFAEMYRTEDSDRPSKTLTPKALQEFAEGALGDQVRKHLNRNLAELALDAEESE